ncbi:integrase arm-type DNA-binding domain-containing protein [Rhodobacterales bacterium HKCCE2091]|nr:integrase arm-type DNA-binding domain-containing protein [Rhodobacterales bacterium HKCCE2091]
MAKLSKRFVDTVKDPGFYGDGEALYLAVKVSGSKSWILRTVVQGRRRDLGIGSASMVSLAEARETAREWRKVARQGGDPRNSQKHRSLTLKEAAHEYPSIVAPSFSSGKHAKLWLSGLRVHVFPTLGDVLLDEIDVTDIRRVLQPIWVAKHETARRIKQRLTAIFEWAKVEGFYTKENPCVGVKRVLKPTKRLPNHHAAMDWRELPAFYAALASRDCVSSHALRLIILTACRSGEVRDATWTEFQGATWTIPAQRTKTRRPHRVPLSQGAEKILARMEGLDRSLVFPSNAHSRSTSVARPLSVNAFRALYDRMGRSGLTTHGFRFTFRD